jgi:hypothetical protein
VDDGAPGEAVTHWITHTLLWEVVFGAVLGAMNGLIAGGTLRWAAAREILETTSLLP